MAKKWEEARVAREAKLDGLQERLVGAVDGLVSGEDWQRAMTFAARFRSRSFNNMLIWSQHVEAFEAGRVPVTEPSYYFRINIGGLLISAKRVWLCASQGQKKFSP